MRMLLYPEPPGLLCLPGGIPTGDPLLVPVAADGGMEFDLAIRDDAVPNGSKTPYEVETRHPRSDRFAGPLMFDVVWRLPPLRCTVEEIPFEFTDVPMERDLGDKNYWHTVRLAWQPEEKSGRYYIEGTRDQFDDARWFLLDWRPAKESGCTISYRMSSSRSGQGGPLKFRIIPSKPVPPKTVDENDQLITAFRLREYAPKDLFQDSDLGFMGYNVISVAYIAKSPVSAKAIFQEIIDKQMSLVARNDVGRDFFISDVSRLEPTVCNGFYVFQVRVESGLLIIVMDSAHPQVAARIFRR